MSSEVAKKKPGIESVKKDRARAFVPELIPKVQEIHATGPLSAREQRDLDRIHQARDNYEQATWLRGMALASAFARRLYRGEDGTRTRQQYLDDEWDGISESAAYREMAEWPLAAEISQKWDGSLTMSHVRALVEAADKFGTAQVAEKYAELRAYAKDNGKRVTAEIAANLSDRMFGTHTADVELGPGSELFALPAAAPAATFSDHTEPVTVQPVLDLDGAAHILDDRETQTYDEADVVQGDLVEEPHTPADRTAAAGQASWVGRVLAAVKSTAVRTGRSEDDVCAAVERYLTQFGATISKG